MLTVPADSLSDHLLAHGMEESEHQQLMVDNEQSKNDFSTLKVRVILYKCVCGYINGL